MIKNQDSKSSFEDFHNLFAEIFGVLNTVSCGGNPAVFVLQFYNGHGTSSPVLATVCGNQVPQVPESSTHFLTLNFVSDGSIAGAGFKSVSLSF